MGKSQKNLRVVIFAGGIGTRMWPLSRKATPKQFEKIIEDKSTLQLTVDRVLPEVGVEDIYISSGTQYVEIIREQLPQIPEENVIGEPKMRDVAPAVGYLMAILAKDDPWGPVAILWSDHLMKHVSHFKNALEAGASYVRKHKEVFVFLGQKPRFANQNLGWIEFGEKISTIEKMAVHRFVSWHYRPSLDKARQYYDDNNYAWNPGYFIVAPQFVINQFKKLQPTMYKSLMKLQETYGSVVHKKQLAEIYPKLKKASFDDAIIAKMSPEQAVVLPVDLGWSDVGTWEALKEALQTRPTQNLTKGEVAIYESQNSVVYNYTDKLLAAVDLKGMVVVVTDDVVMVVPQESIPKVKKMLETFKGTGKEKYT